MRFQRNVYHFGLPIRIGGKVLHFGTFSAFGQGVFFVARYADNREAFNIAYAAQPVLVDHVVNGALVVLFEHARMDDVLANEHFFLHLGDDTFTIPAEHDDLIDVRTVAHKLVLFQARTNETVFRVHIQLHIGQRHLGGFYFIKGAQLGFSFAALAVFFLVYTSDAA